MLLLLFLSPWASQEPRSLLLSFNVYCLSVFSSSDMSNGEEDSACGEDDEIWEEEGGYLVISADKVHFYIFSG